MNTADYLLEHGRSGAPALLTSQGSHTYGELRQAGARLAAELRHRGVQPGGRVALLGENSLFWAASYLAVMKIGAVAVLFPTVSTVDDLRSKQDFLQCSLLLADERSLRKFGAAFPQDLPRLSSAALDEPGESWWGDSPAEGPAEAALMLTSGTTARPRAVRITHRNIQANTDSIIAYLELDAAECILAVLPFYYCFGTSLLHTHLRAGGSLALCNTFAYPETALEMIEHSGCTGFAGVPSTYQTLLRNTSFPRRSLPTLRKLQQAGGKLQPALLQELVAAAPQAKVYVMYGQTEATARLSYLPPELLPAKFGSIGKGIPGVELRVVNEAGEPVKPGEVGEIIARGENISPGYWQEPESSAEKFVNGELRTGDLATVDEDGYLYVVDRKSDFIKVYGYRVSSQEIEARILDFPEVVAAAVVGIPDPVQGEAVVAFVVLSRGASLPARAIVEHCARRLPRHMLPSRVIFLDQLPTNAHSKVVKSVLRELAAQKQPEGS